MEMRGREKGGLAPAIPEKNPDASLAGRIDAFLKRLESLAYSTTTVEMHRWALRQFLGWARGRGLDSPEIFTRALLEEYQQYLHEYRSPRTGGPLVVITQPTLL